MSILSEKILIIGGAGYIGTALFDHLIRLNANVDICDLGKRGLSHVTVKFPVDSGQLSKEDLSAYTAVIWLAGFSNVKDSLNDPEGAIEGNASKLAGLAFKLNPETTFIYASTGSLYSSLTPPTQGSLETDVIFPGNNAYDVSKFCFDYISQSLIPNFMALRLGTVSGFSRNLRPELIFNAMCRSALKEKKVYVSNADAMRSIVFLEYLTALITEMILKKPKGKHIFNVSNFSGSIGNIGKKIASHFNADIVTLPSSPTYSFCLNSEKVETLFPIQATSFETQIEHFMNSHHLELH